MLKYWRFIFVLGILLGEVTDAFSQSDSIPQESSQLYRLGMSEIYSQLQATIPEYFAPIEVSSASKITQNQKDAPNIINAFSRKEYLQYGLISPNELLYAQPSFFATRDYERRTVGFRGMFESWNNNTILMLLDGIPFNDAVSGTAFSWEVTPLFFAKSVEIIRGAGGALYGSNAMNGVFSINTLEVSDLGHYIGEARLRYGSRNTQIFDFLLGAENKHFGLLSSFSYFKTDGLNHKIYDASERTDDQGIRQQFEIDDRRHNINFFNKIYGKGKFEGLSMQFHVQEWDFRTGYGWLFEVPDQPENMQQNRQLFALQYRPTRKDKKLQYELSFRYQRQGINWLIRYFPNGALDNFYPHGVTELLRSYSSDIFLRLQADYQTSFGHFLAGFERGDFIYNGDESHTSNVDLEETRKPFPDNEFRTIRPWLEYIDGQPVTNYSGFLQYVSPRFWNKLQLTISGRYDRKHVDYKNIKEINQPLKHKVFDLFTPRVALVFHPTEKWTLKTLVGRAFRMPAPTELFARNTFGFASNIEELEPELVTNYDFSNEFRWTKNMTVRTNFYLVNFENKIGYSATNYNLSTNIYTLLTAGIEAELFLRYKNWQGFLNYTYAQRLNEKITDTTIEEYKTTLTSAPAHLLNAGATLEYKAFFATFLGHYHGVQKRKATDFFEQSELYRPNEIPAWVNLDVQIGYTWKHWLEIRFLMKNVLNSSQKLLKIEAYPFDYKQESRVIQSELRIKF